MKKLLVTLSLASLGVSSQAAFIDGNFQYNQLSNLDISAFTPANLLTATQVNMPNGNNSEVAVSVSGDFDTYLNLGDDFSLPDLNWGAAWPAVNGGALTFSLGGFTFTGTFVSEFQSANFVNLFATGFFTGNGFDATYGEATIGYTKVSGTEVSYSGTVTAFNDDEAPPENPTPEGGTTVALLGVALAGLVLIPRRKTA